MCVHLGGLSNATQQATPICNIWASVGGAEEDDSISVVICIMRRRVMDLLSGLDQSLLYKEAATRQSQVSAASSEV